MLPSRKQLLPTGSLNSSFIFVRRSPFAEKDPKGHFLTQPAAVACGHLTRPLVLQGSMDAGMIDIRFKPSGMAPFLSTSMQSITDARVSAEDLFPEIHRLIEETVASSNDGQRIAACNRFLFGALVSKRENPRVPAALQRILQAHGHISVESLASHIGASRRSLEMAHP